MKLADYDFMTSMSFHTRCLYLCFALCSVRNRYYLVWTLAECIHNSIGIGYDHEKKDWSGIVSIRPLKLEFGTNSTDYLRYWNIQTNKWLRYVVYERTSRKYNTFLTFALSAVWHGFYPGDYLFYINHALLVTSHRKLKKSIFPKLEKRPFLHRIQKILSWPVYALVMNYMGPPFIFKNIFPHSFSQMKSFYFLGHFATAFVILLPLDKFL